MDKTFVVYAHTNKINGKKYIGITCQSVDERWRNGKGYKNPKFRNAINKYGWDSFKHEILYTGLTQSEAEQKEQELIKKYDSMENGYNACEGGGVSVGYRHTKESKEKMYKTRKERGTCAGKNNPMYGRSGELSPVYGLKRSEEFRKAKMASVLRIDESGNTIEEFESVKSAAEKYGINKTVLSNAICRGSKCHGMIFIHKEKRPKYSRPKMSEERKNKVGKKVMAYKGDEKIIFERIALAAEYFGVKQQSISYAMRKEGRKSCGYNWKYINDKQEVNE